MILPQPDNSFLPRRRFLVDTGMGLGAIALRSLLGRQDPQGTKSPIRPTIDAGHPYAPRPPHAVPRAKNVVVIFCSGAVSQLDTFDYKPELIRRHGQPLPGHDNLVTFQGKQGALTKSPWAFRQRGRTGK
ncbi:MAG: hypothetical protein ACI9SE_003852, partial [Neolewinella sp.]